MIQDLELQVRLQKEEEFYQKEFFFSYSSLSKLLYNPEHFFSHYILNVKEDKDAKHLQEGKLIHLLLLERDKFDSMYLVSPAKLPEGNNKLVVDLVFRKYLQDMPDISVGLEYYREAILSILQDLDLHQSLVDDKPKKEETILKTGDDKRLDKILSDSNKNYWEFLKMSLGKTVIDQQTYDYCSKAVEVIRNNDKVAKLLGLGFNVEKSEVHNELPLSANLKEYSFGIKGIIDSIKIDHDNKIIYINDIKTTQKELKEFNDSVFYYKYWIQCIIYIMLCTNKFQELIDAGYVVEFHFIVLDKNLHCYPFRVSETTRNWWYEDFMKVLQKAEYHYTQKDYTLPYDFSMGLIEL